MNHEKQNRIQRQRRTFRVRKPIRGTTERPRLCIVRSHKHMYAQVIDDSDGRTLASAATTESTLKGQVKYGGNKKAAEAVGQGDCRAGHGGRHQASVLRSRQRQVSRPRGGPGRRRPQGGPAAFRLLH